MSAQDMNDFNNTSETSHIQKPEFSVIITCYYEEKSIDEFYTRLSNAMNSLNRTYEIVFVNDGSTDKTFEKLKMIFDKGPHVTTIIDLFKNAGQAFGVRIGDKSIMEYGNISAISFHVTKLFSSIEGGALVSRSEKQRTRIQFLRNFGIADAETIIGPGINGKMNEFQASFGLLELDVVDEEIEGRQTLTYLYHRLLSDVPGITCLKDIPGVRHNYSYLPILIDPETFGMSRDTLSEVLGKCNIHSRKYFYPLCSNYPCYSALPSSAPEHLPVANQVAGRILCLPLYGELDEETIRRICLIIEECRGTA